MMKSLLLSLAIVLLAMFSSCTHDSEVEPAYTGDTQMMDCFNRIGIKTADNRGQLMYIIPDNLPSEFNVEGKHLRFDVEIRANALVPSMPDPSVDASTLFQGAVSNVREVE